MSNTNNFIFRIGFVPIYFDLYDDWGKEIREAFIPMVKCIKELVKGEGVLIESKTVSNISESEEMADFFIDEKVDIVVTLHLVYSPSMIIADSIKRIRKPVIILDTSLVKTFKNMDSNFLMQNHALPGIQDLSSVLRSKSVKYSVIVGYYKDKSFQNELKRKLLLFKAARSFHNQRIGITGKPFKQMGDFEISKSEMRSLFSAKVIDINNESILKEEDKINEKDINKIFDNDKDLYVSDEIREIDHKASIRTYIALKTIIKDKALDAYTMNFREIKGFPVPFYAISKLMMEGYGYAGEGDVLTALLGKPLNILSKKAMFGEFFSSDWDSELMIVSHMGETNPEFSKRGTKIILKPKTLYKYYSASIYFKFSLEPCVLTFITIIKGLNGGRELLTGIVKVEDLQPYEAFDAPHFIIKTSEGINRFREKYCLSGGGHHLYFAMGNIVKDLKELSNYLDIPCNDINDI